MKSERIIAEASSDAEAVVTEAQREAERAAAEASELKNRILSGDEKVSAADLAAAESESELRRLRVTAAESVSAKRIQKARTEAVEALRSELEGSLPAGLEEVVAEYEKAIAAVAEFVGKIDGWNAEVREAASRLSNPDIQPLPASMRVNGGASFSSGGSVEVGSVRVLLFDPLPVISEIAYRAIQVHHDHEMNSYGGSNLAELGRAANAHHAKWLPDQVWVKEIVEPGAEG